MVCTKLPCTATQGVNGMTEGERKRLEGDVRKSMCLVTRKKMAKPPAGRALSEGKEAPQAAFPSWCFPAHTKRRTEGIRVPVPLACGIQN